MKQLFEKIKNYINIFLFGTDKEKEMMQLFDYDEYEKNIARCENVVIPSKKLTKKKVVKVARVAKKPAKKVIKSSKMMTSRKTKEK